MNTKSYIITDIPKHMEQKLFYVNRDFRTNPLSHEPGGFDVIVELWSGCVYHYDWVKFPGRYVEKIHLCNTNESGKKNPTAVRRVYLWLKGVPKMMEVWNCETFSNGIRDSLEAFSVGKPLSREVYQLLKENTSVTCN